MYIPKWNPQNAIDSYLALIFGSTDKKTLERIDHQDETELFVFPIWTNLKRARTKTPPKGVLPWRRWGDCTVLLFIERTIEHKQ